jgi:hypothetical protein
MLIIARSLPCPRRLTTLTDAAREVRRGMGAVFNDFGRPKTGNVAIA